MSSNEGILPQMTQMKTDEIRSYSEILTLDYVQKFVNLSTSIYDNPRYLRMSFLNFSPRSFRR